MSTVEKIVGINLIILALYCAGASFLDGSEGGLFRVVTLGLLVIPLHFLTCVVIAIVKKIHKKGAEEERKLLIRGFVFSAFIVLVVGFPACFLVASL